MRSMKVLRSGAIGQRTAVRALASAALAWLLVAPGIAAGDGTDASLVVVEQAGCVFCARFDAEIAEAWPNTEQGRRAPLRRVDLHAEWPADLAGVARPALTPTFVLVDGAGREVDRLAGYPGDEHFWFLLDGMLSGLAPAADD